MCVVSGNGRKNSTCIHNNLKGVRSVGNNMGNFDKENNSKMIDFN